MQTIPISIPRDKARELYREYRKHQHYSTPMDQEVRRAYQLLAQGRLIIKALESIKAAGVNDDGLPNLAICRADQTRCRWEPNWQGGAGMMVPETSRRWRHSHAFDQKFIFTKWPEIRGRADAVAIVPTVPLHLRPKRGLQNYHILFEAIWEPVPPRDPYLLRRIGKGDMWLVVVAWDLTEIERTALAARITAA